MPGAGGAATDTSVLIVGAGPSGLTLANVLAQHGVAATVVDAKGGPAQESRAAIVHIRTLELLDGLGLADRAVERGLKTTSVEVFERGRPAGQFPIAGRGAEGLTRFPYALVLEQEATERLLVQGLEDRGGHVDWRTELVAFEDGERGVTATVQDGGGSERTVTARWLVGADGASSLVRHLTGMAFAGETYQQTGLLADVEMAEGPRRGALHLNLTRGGFVGVLPLPSGRYRLFGAVPPTLTPDRPDAGISHEAYGSVPLAVLQRWFDDYFVLRTEIEAAHWTSVYRIHSRMAERFRSGNVFLIGDAAHIHSPAGGQGMNLGIGDAVNLGWKLALLARGDAAPALVDTYEAERLPVARTVLRGADRAFQLEALSNPIAEWARANIATRLVGPVTSLPAARRAVFRLLSQTWISYRDSPAVGDGRSASRGGLRPGDRAPCGYPGAGEHEPAHHALVFQGRRGAGIAHRADEVERLLAAYGPAFHVRVVEAEQTRLDEQYGVDEARLVIIRPDGHIAFMGDPGDLDALATYLDRLFTTHDGGVAPRPASGSPTR